MISKLFQDGGLYFPESIPKLSKEDLEDLSKCSYIQIVKKILRLFIDESEIPAADMGK